MKQFIYKQSQGCPYFLEDITEIPTAVDFKIYTGADPEDKIRLFIGYAPDIKEVTYDWSHNEFPSTPMDEYFMGSSILFDIETMNGRDLLAQLLTKISNEYRKGVNQVFSRGWILRDGKQIYYEYSNVNRPGADKVVALEVPTDPTWKPVGLNSEVLDDQLKFRKFCNSVNFEHGIPSVDISFTRDTANQIKPRVHKTVLVDTINWSDLGEARNFLGLCKLNRINMLIGATSPDYTYGKVPSWVNVNPLSRIGVVDMLRKGTPAPKYPWVGVSDYVKLDYRCPQFSFHVGRMSYNPAVQIIVVLHDIHSDLPEALNEEGRSSFHEKQFKVIAESVRHQNNRKPVLFKVSIPGVAAALQDAGIHVSPTVDDCMDDLHHVVGLFINAGEIKSPMPTVELIDDDVEVAAKVIQGAARKWLKLRSIAALKIQNLIKKIF